MNYDQQMQQVVDQAKKDVNEIAREVQETLAEMRVKHQQDVSFLASEFRERTNKNLEEAKRTLEQTKRNLLAAAGGAFAFFLLGFVMFIYYEAKDINRSILDLHTKIQSSEQFLDREVEKFEKKSIEINAQMDSIMEANRSALSNLSQTSSQYESRLTEINALSVDMNRSLQEVQTLIEEPEFEVWQEAWIEEE